MLKSDGTRRDFPLTRSRTILGRTSEADLRIPLPSVSRRHCEVAIEGDVLRVRDLGSSNGTNHNSVRVSEATLAAGDRIEIGGVEFLVVIDGVGGAAAPPVPSAEPVVVAEAPSAAQDMPTLAEPLAAAAAAAPPVAAEAEVEQALPDDEDDAAGHEMPTVILEPGPPPLRKTAAAAKAPSEPRGKLLDPQAAAKPAPMEEPILVETDAEAHDALAALMEFADAPPAQSAAQPAAKALPAQPAAAKPAASVKPAPSKSAASKPAAVVTPEASEIPPAFDDDPIAALERLADAQAQSEALSMLAEVDIPPQKPGKKK